jgi:hypothetical protein
MDACREEAKEAVHQYVATRRPHHVKKACGYTEKLAQDFSLLFGAQELEKVESSILVNKKHVHASIKIHHAFLVRMQLELTSSCGGTRVSCMHNCNIHAHFWISFSCTRTYKLSTTCRHVHQQNAHADLRHTDEHTDLQALIHTSTYLYIYPHTCPCIS